MLKLGDDQHFPWERQKYIKKYTNNSLLLDCCVTRYVTCASPKTSYDAFLLHNIRTTRATNMHRGCCSPPNVGAASPHAPAWSAVSLPGLPRVQCGAKLHADTLRVRKCAVT